MKISHASALTAALALLTAPSLAQVPLLRFQGEEFWQLREVAPVGDVDGDGVVDLVLGARTGRFTVLNQLIVGGAVQLVSGRDGHLLHPTIFGLDADEFGFVLDGVGDVDGDGIPDFAGGSPKSDGFLGQIDVWSGGTGDLLTHIPLPIPPTGSNSFGVTVVGLGDLDGDGSPELAGTYVSSADVTIHHASGGGLMRIHRHSDGSGLPGTGGGGSPRVASLGDVDADGVPDYVIGYWSNGKGKLGLVVLISGASGKELFRLLGNDVGAVRVGYSVSRMGDMDGDGITDFVAGDPVETDATFNTKRGAALILSGKTGAVIRRIDGPRVTRFAKGNNFTFVHGGQDVNGDGVPDLVVGNRNADRQFDPFLGFVRGGTVEVYSGATGTMLWRVRPDYACSLLGDLDGDGLSEWGHGDSWFSNPIKIAGQVTVYRGATGDAHRVCTAKPNSLGIKARLELDGPISRRANQLALYVEGGVPAQTGQFFYGPELVSQPFGDGILCAGGGSLGLRRIGNPVTLDAAGSVLTEIDMTKGPMASGPAAWTVGSTWTLQFYYRDPWGTAGFNLSDAMRVTWTP